MRKLQSFGQYEEEYYRKHPEEIDSYLKTIFEEWAKDGDTGALLASLRTISRVKGISALAEETGMSRQGIQHALSEQGNPRLETLNAIMQAIGYRLIPEKLAVSAGK